MTVGELIQRLERHPCKDDLVLVQGYEGGYEDIRVRGCGLERGHQSARRENPDELGTYDQVYTEGVDVEAVFNEGLLLDTRRTTVFIERCNESYSE